MLNIFQKENLDVKENELLAPYTTFKIGGPARYFFAAENADDIVKAVKIAEKNKISVHIMGGGSNSLISDKGFDGLAIKIQNSEYTMRNTSIEAGAGVLLSKLVAEAAKNNLTGLEWAMGIPGTIGGAVRGNAGAYGQAIGEAVKSVQYLNLSSPFGKGGLRGILTPKIKKLNPSLTLPLRKGENCFKIQNFDNKECEFGYRDSIFKQNPNLIILEVELKLKKGDSKDIKKKMAEIISGRAKKIPPFPSAGSFFKNIELSRIYTSIDDRQQMRKKFPQAADEQIDSWLERKKIPAAWLIEECGLKGKQIGGAKISDEHANFIINTGKARAKDVIMLASLIKQQVRDKFNVRLEEEVELIGF